MAEPGFQYFTPHRIGPHRGVRSSRYKLIEYFAEGPDVWEFFDLERDPDELINRYDDAESQHLVKKMKGELSRLRDQYGDEH